MQISPFRPRLSRPENAVAPAAHVTLLDRYVGLATLRAFGMMAAGLTALFSLLEFVEQLSSVGKGHYRLVDALVYVLLTVPSRLMSVTPVSVLLGSLLALGALARQSELTAMRSVGVSEARIVGAVLKLLVPLAAVLFLLAEFVIPPAQQLAQAERNAALSAAVPLHRGEGIWAQGDGQFLNVQHFDSDNKAREIEIYAFTPDGRMSSIITADSADIDADGTWHLAGVLRRTVNGGQFDSQRLDSLAWHSVLPARQAELLVLPPDSMPPTALFQYVRGLQQRHQQALRYEQALWGEISIPLALIAMVMTAAPFVFGPPRAQNTGRQITIGAVFGIVFSLCQQIVGRLGLLLNLDAAVTALAPPLLFIALSGYLFRQAHRPASSVQPAPPDPRRTGRSDPAERQEARPGQG